MGLTALFIQHRRATYDLLAGSIVVMQPVASLASPLHTQQVAAPAAAAGPDAALVPPVPAAGSSGVAPSGGLNSQPAVVPPDESESDTDVDDDID